MGSKSSKIPPTIPPTITKALTERQQATQYLIDALYSKMWTVAKKIMETSEIDYKYSGYRSERTGDGRCTVLTVAVEKHCKENYDIVKKIIENASVDNINRQYSDGDNLLLHLLVSRGSLNFNEATNNVIKCLIQHGIDLNHKFQNETALSLAIKFQNEEIAFVILDKLSQVKCDAIFSKCCSSLGDVLQDGIMTIVKSYI
jgi:hypothetical protein